MLMSVRDATEFRLRRMWIGCPVLFLLWSNLDGSVIFGVFVLAGLAAGRLVDVTVTSRRVFEGLCDERFRQAVYLAELAALISVAQPLGIRLWGELIENGHSSVWQSRGAASPLVLFSATGAAIGSAWIAGAVLLRLSPRPIVATDVILFGLGSFAAIANQMMSIWALPLMLWVLLPHLSEVLERLGLFAAKKSRLKFESRDSVPPLAFAFTMLSILALWCGFALSPISNPILGGRPRPLREIMSKNTPFAFSKYLTESNSVPAGLVWVPEDWGDWLSFNGPPGLKISANSQIQLLTNRQKSDIDQVNRADGNWTKTLDRYGVELLVVDKQRQSRLVDAALAQSPEWSVCFEDDQALVLRRKS